MRAVIFVRRWAHYNGLSTDPSNPNSYKSPAGDDILAVRFARSNIAFAVPLSTGGARMLLPSDPALIAEELRRPDGPLHAYQRACAAAKQEAEAAAAAGGKGKQAAAKKAALPPMPLLELLDPVNGEAVVVTEVVMPGEDEWWEQQSQQQGGWSCTLMWRGACP